VSPCANRREIEYFGEQAITLVLYGTNVSILIGIDYILHSISGNSGFKMDELFPRFWNVTCKEVGAISGSSLY
jgi:hypothetical protein